MALLRTWMGSVSPASGQAVPLVQLLQAAGYVISSNPLGSTLSVAEVQIELDINAGSTNLYIGNSNVSPTNCGRHLIASGIQDQGKATLSLVNLSELYLYIDTAAQQVNITIAQEWRVG